MILVTGGSGLVGRHLVSELLQRGYRLRCLLRHPERNGFMQVEGVELFQGDVCEPGSLQGAMEGVKAVIHLVAVIREKGLQGFGPVNVEGTKNMVVAAEAAGCRRFIHLSALGATNDPRYRYAYSKWLGEEAVRRSSLDWTIFRPSVLYGRGFGFFDRLHQSLRLSPWPFVIYPQAAARFQPLAAGDLARCLVISLDDRRTVGQVFELGGPEQFTYREMLEVYLEFRGIRRFPVGAPIALLRQVVPVMQRLLPDPPVTTVELKQMELGSTTGLENIKNFFGFSPRTLRDGLGRT